MNTRLDYLWEKVSLFTQFSDLAKIFEPIFFKISLKTGPIFDHPLLVKIGSEIENRFRTEKPTFSRALVYMYPINTHKQMLNTLSRAISSEHTMCAHTLSTRTNRC